MSQENFPNAYLDFAKTMLAKRNEICVTILDMEAQIDELERAQGIDTRKARIRSLKKELKSLADSVLTKASAKDQGSLFEGESQEESEA